MNPLKILLVDDSKSARYALRLQLQQHNVAVETADSAESALKQVGESPPDAIFMDHTMPGMSGFEALDILKGAPATAHIPVVMCTSHEDPKFIAQAKKKGAIDILSKATAAEKLGPLLDRLQQAEAPTEKVATAVPEQGVEEWRETEVATSAEDLLAEDRLEARIRTIVEPLVDARAERLAADLRAGLDAQVEVLALASIEPLIDDLTKHLTEDLLAKTNELLVSGLNLQAERLQEDFSKTQNEQMQQTAERLLNERLPQLIREHLKQEEQDLTKRVRELVDASLDDLIANPAFLRGISDAVETSVTDSARQIARRQATEISEAVTGEWAKTVAGLMVPTKQESGARTYLLSAAAGLVGILSAAVVYLLLS